MELPSHIHHCTWSVEHHISLIISVADKFCKWRVLLNFPFFLSWKDWHSKLIGDEFLLRGNWRSPFLLLGVIVLLGLALLEQHVHALLSQIWRNISLEFLLWNCEIPVVSGILEFIWTYFLVLAHGNGRRLQSVVLDFSHQVLLKTVIISVGD